MGSEPLKCKHRDWFLRDLLDGGRLNPARNRIEAG